MRPLAEAECVFFARQLAGLDPWRSLGFSAAGLEAYLKREDSSVLRSVAVVEGRLSGLIALRKPWLRGPYIELLAVLPESQGMGIGSLMVDWALEQARPSRNLWACVSDFNHAARDFYARRGFAEIAPLEGLVSEERAEILLRRRLP